MAGNERLTDVRTGHALAFGPAGQVKLTAAIAAIMAHDNRCSRSRRQRVTRRRKGPLFAANTEPRTQSGVAIKGDRALVA